LILRITARQRLLGRVGEHDLFAVASTFPLDVEAEEVETGVEVGDEGLLFRESHLQRAGQPLTDLLAKRVRVGPGAVHEHDEVVCVADQPVVRQPLAASLLPAPGRAHDGVPAPGEVPVQHRQVDVGQHRRHDSSNAVGNFCFEVSLSYRRAERPRRVTESA